MVQRSLQRAGAVVRDAVLAIPRDDEDLTLARTGKRCVVYLDDRGKGGRHSIADDDGHDDQLSFLAAYQAQDTCPRPVPGPGRAISLRRSARNSRPPSGVINAEGDMKIHVINVYSDPLERDTRFNLDFSLDVLTGPAHPHGLVVLPARDG